jgi:hypothetical protein
MALENAQELEALLWKSYKAFCLISTGTCECDGCARIRLLRDTIRKTCKERGLLDPGLTAVSEHFIELERDQ